MEPENNKTYLALTLVTFAAIIAAITFLYLGTERYKVPDEYMEMKQNPFK